MTMAITTTIPSRAERKVTLYRLCEIDNLQHSFFLYLMLYTYYATPAYGIRCCGTYPPGPLSDAERGSRAGSPLPLRKGG